MARIDLSSGLRLSGDIAGMNTSVLRNWRVETPDGAEATPNVPRKPLSSYATGLSADVIGLYRFKTNVIAVCSDGYSYRLGDTNPAISIALSASVDTASIASGTLRPTFAEDPSDVFFARGFRIKKWTPGTPTVTEITAANGPTTCTHVAYIGQRLVANDTSSAANRQRFFYSDLGDGSDSTWGALNFQTPEGRPDEVVALAENTAELYVWGTSTLQVYGISSDSRAPFSQANTVNVGMGAYYSAVQVDDRFAWIDDKRRIVLSDGRQVEVISDDIETWLRASTTSDAFGWRETSDRWDLLCFQFPTARRTLVYNLKTKTWSEDTRLDGGVTRQMPIGAYCYRPFDNRHLFGSSLTGAIYERAASNGTDMGSEPIVCERMTGVNRFGTWKRKRSNRIRCVLRRGTSGPSGTSDVLEVRVRDDGEDWSEWEQVDIGNDGDQVQHVDVHHGGVFVGRQHHFRYAGTDDTALIEAHDDVEELET